MQSEFMWDAFDYELQQFWPVERELLAVIVELLHSLVRVTAKGFGAKSVPKQIRVPRPVQTPDQPKAKKSKPSRGKGSATHVTRSPATRQSGPVFSMGEYVRQLKTED